jgi:hypothetical protein
VSAQQPIQEIRILLAGEPIGTHRRELEGCRFDVLAVDLAGGDRDVVTVFAQRHADRYERLQIPERSKCRQDYPFRN